MNLRHRKLSVILFFLSWGIYAYYLKQISSNGWLSCLNSILEILAAVLGSGQKRTRMAGAARVGSRGYQLHKENKLPWHYHGHIRCIGQGKRCSRCYLSWPMPTCAKHLAAGGGMVHPPATPISSAHLTSYSCPKWVVPQWVGSVELSCVNSVKAELTSWQRWVGGDELTRQTK